MILQGLQKHNQQQQRVLLVVLLAAVLQCSSTSARPQESNSTLRKGRYDPTVYGSNRGKYMPDDSGKYRHVAMPYDGGYGDTGMRYAHDNRSVYQRPPEPFALGPRDHLHFMVDFNYNGSGWQILHFEWKRDGHEPRLFKYVGQHPLWSEVMAAPGATPVESTSTTQSDIEPPVESDAVEMEPVADDAGTEAEVYTDVTIEPTVSPGESDAGEGEDEMVTGAPVDSDDMTSTIRVVGDYDPVGEPEKIFNLKYSNDDGSSQAINDQLREAIKEILTYVQMSVVPSLS